MRDATPSMVRALEARLARPSPLDDPLALAAELDARGFDVHRSRAALVAWPRTRKHGDPYQLLVAPDGDPGAAAVLLSALDALAEVSVEPTLTPVVFAGGDDGRQLLRLVARGASRALVLGPPERGSGRVWTARPGRARFVVTARAAAPPAFTSGDACARAILELRRHAPGLYALADPLRGVAVDVGRIRAHPRRNGDEPTASLTVTAFARTADAARHVEAGIRALRAAAPGIVLETTGGWESAPMERLARSRALFGAAVRLGRALGQEIVAAPTAPEPSLANVTNPYTATLDGLGPDLVDGRPDEAAVAARGALVSLLLLERQGAPRVRHLHRPDGGRIAILGDAANEANLEVVAGWRELGLDAELVRPDGVRHDDVVLGRLDVLPTLDGVEPGLLELLLFERRGVRVLNGATMLVRAHDKLLTARSLARAGVPHPWTAHLTLGGPVPLIAPPLVVKPRFGSWGGDVHRCETRAELDSCLAEIADRGWFRRHGALLQALVPPVGSDLRVLVAAGSVVGAIERRAQAGEWRTNISLGGSCRGVDPPALACEVAVAAARAIGADLVGVDLLPLDDGWTVLELNGAVEFDAGYSLRGSDVFRATAAALGLLERASSRAPLLTVAG